MHFPKQPLTATDSSVTLHHPSTGKHHLPVLPEPLAQVSGGWDPVWEGQGPGEGGEVLLLPL